MKTMTHTIENNSFKFVGKNLKNIGLVFLAALSIASCTNNDGDAIEPMPTPATAAQFANVQKVALDAKKQKFTATAGAGSIVVTTSKGVKITINGNVLTKNGVAVTGTFDITVIELFDKGNMLVTNKPTMGIMADGNRNLLKSGGEFYVNASQDGVDLVANGTIIIQIPTTITGTPDAAMTLWNGVIDDKGNLAWADARNAAGTGGKGGVEATQNGYYVSFGNFGWTNVDKFYSDPRPKTTILAGAPSGYDNTNSAIYLSYDGEGANALAKLDTFIAASGLFSEHYGQIPVGLACHIIFATEDNGQWRYAIKAVTITANTTYSFTLAETTVGSEAQLVAAINAIQ